jgi:hypothetical protein
MTDEAILHEMMAEAHEQTVADASDGAAQYERSNAFA